MAVSGLNQSVHSVSVLFSAFDRRKYFEMLWEYEHGDDSITAEIISVLLK